jgi:hypothetical protein
MTAFETAVTEPWLYNRFINSELEQLYQDPPLVSFIL